MYQKDVFVIVLMPYSYCMLGCYITPLISNVCCGESQYHFTYKENCSGLLLLPGCYLNI